MISSYRITNGVGPDKVMIDHYWRKNAKRIVNGGYISLFNSMTLTITGSMSIMMHTRLESCYGGHTSYQAMCRKTDGGGLYVGKGWSFYHDVSVGKMKVWLSDGSNSDTLEADIDEDMLSVWVMVFDTTSNTAKLFKDSELQDTVDITGWSNINESSMNIKIGDDTYGCSLMLGGFMITSDALTPTEIEMFNTDKDSEWDTSINNQILHIAGEGYDQWSGLGASINDIEDTTLVWKDVTGNGHKTVSSSTGTQDAMNTARIMKKSIGATFETLSVAYSGSNMTLKVPWDTDLSMGDVVYVEGVSNAWTGIVETIEQGQQGKTLKCIGFDEGKTAVSSEDSSNYGTGTNNMHMTHSDGVYINQSSDTDEHNPRFRGDSGVMMYAWDLHSGGIGNTRKGPLKCGVLTGIAMAMSEMQYSLESVSKSIRESASHVKVFFDTGVDVPGSESFEISTSTSEFTLSEYPTSIVEITANGVQKKRGDYTFNPDKKVVKFKTALTSSNSPLLVKYQTKDIIVGEAFDFNVMQKIGGNKYREFHETGRPSQAVADSTAESYIHGPYHALSIVPIAKYGWPVNWYVGKGIQINNSNDTQGINGNYRVAKIQWEGSINNMPTLSLEETTDKFLMVSNFADQWMRRNLRDSRSTYGY